MRSGRSILPTSDRTRARIALLVALAGCALTVCPTSLWSIGGTLACVAVVCTLYLWPLRDSDP